MQLNASHGMQRSRGGFKAAAVNQQVLHVVQRSILPTTSWDSSTAKNGHRQWLHI
jgi:hypothetical protein